MSIASTSSSSPLEFSPLARFWNDELRRPIVVVSNQSGIGRGHYTCGRLSWGSVPPLIISLSSIARHSSGAEISPAA